MSVKKFVISRKAEKLRAKYRLWHMLTLYAIVSFALFIIIQLNRYDVPVLRDAIDRHSYFMIFFFGTLIGSALILAIPWLIVALNPDKYPLNETEMAEAEKNYNLDVERLKEIVKDKELSARIKIEEAAWKAKLSAVTIEAKRTKAHELRMAAEEQARFLAEREERQKQEKKEAAEAAYWASPEGQKVKTARLLAAIEVEKAEKIAGIQTAQLKEATGIATEAAEGAHARSKEQMGDLMGFAEKGGGQ